MVTIDGRTKGRGGPKFTLEAVVRKDLAFLDTTEHNTLRETSMEQMNLCSRLQLIGTLRLGLIWYGFVCLKRGYIKRLIIEG